MEDKHAAIHGEPGSSKWCIGGDVDEVFNRLTPELPQGETPDFLAAIDAIIARKTGDYVVEHSMSKLLPQAGELGSVISGRNPQTNSNSSVLGVPVF